MSDSKLKVRLNSKAMVPDYKAFSAGIMRFVGRVHDHSLGEKDKNGIAQGGWIPTNEVFELEVCREYLDELKSGALIPADEQTAWIAGLKFSKKSEK